MSETKDSGVYWLGKVASDWDLVPAWKVMDERKERSQPEDNHLTPSQTYGVVTQQEYMEITGNKVVLNLTGADNMKRVCPGDFIIHLRSFQGGIEASTVGGKVSNAYTVLIPQSGAYFDYYRWFMKSAPLIEGLASSTDQLRDGQSINFSRFSRLTLPLPPLETQQRIAAYLDRETAEIDAAVADLDLYVELLEKRRSTLIAETVTGNAVFRSTSEVQKEKVQPRTHEILYPWLSYSDPTWQRVPFASFLRVKKTVVGRAWTETPLLSLTRRGVVERDISNNEGKIPASFVDYQMVVPGDLVMCLFDVDETPRTVGLSGLPGMITSAYTVFDVNRDVADPKYVEWFLIHIDDRKMFKPIYTGLRKVVRKDALLQCRLNLPPLNVQQSITNYLDRETAQIDALIAESTKLRDLLLKRRSVLITEVVTGRKQV